MIHEEGKIWFPCDLCGSKEHDLVFEKEGFRHVRCRSCGMVFVNPRLADHTTIQTVAGTGLMGDDELTGAQVRRLRKELKQLETYRELNRILEIGAGRGWFLSEAAAAGWETWAVEINAEALQHLAQQGIHKVIVELAESFEAPPDSMDVVRIWDVIEHLSSPRKAMSHAYRALRRAGLLKLSTTNFASLSRWVNGSEWVYLNGSDHIFLFEPPTIKRLLEEVGFSDVSIRTRSFNLRRKLYHPERELPPASLLLAPLRKIIDAAVGWTRFGHQMIVTAVKR